MLGQSSPEELRRRGAFYFYNRLMSFARRHSILHDDAHLLNICSHALELARTIITAPSGSLTDDVADEAYRRLVIAYVELSSAL